MKTASIVAMTVIYLVGGVIGWACNWLGADAPLLFWIIGAVTGIGATLASQIEA